MRFYERPSFIVIDFDEADVLTYSGEAQGADVDGGDDWHMDIFDDIWKKSA